MHGGQNPVKVNVSQMRFVIAEDINREIKTHTYGFAYLSVRAQYYYLVYDTIEYVVSGAPRVTALAYEMRVCSSRDVATTPRQNNNPCALYARRPSASPPHRSLGFPDLWELRRSPCPVRDTPVRLRVADRPG